LQNAGNELAFNGFALSPGGETQRRRSDSVDVAQGSAGGFVEDGDGVVGEQILGATDATDADTDVVGGIVGTERADRESMVSDGMRLAATLYRRRS